MSDETLIGRAVRKARQDQGPAKPPLDWAKLLPIALMAVTAYGGYQVMSYRVERLEADFREYRAEQKDIHAAIWQRLGGRP